MSQLLETYTSRMGGDKAKATRARETMQCEIWMRIKRPSQPEHFS